MYAKLSCTSTVRLCSIEWSQPCGQLATVGFTLYINPERVPLLYFMGVNCLRLLCRKVPFRAYLHVLRSTGSTKFVPTPG